MFSFTIHELAARKLRLLSTAFAVLIGVTLMAGTLVFTDTLSATFDSAVADARSGVDVMVRANSDVDRSFGQTGPRTSTRRRSTTSATSTASRPRRSRYPATPSSSTVTATPSATRNKHRRSASTGSTMGNSTRSASRSADRHRAATRSSSTGPRPTRATSPSAIR